MHTGVNWTILHVGLLVIEGVAGLPAVLLHAIQVVTAGLAPHLRATPSAMSQSRNSGTTSLMEAEEDRRGEKNNGEKINA